MFDFLYMGKHTIFVYMSYIFSIVVLFAGYYFPHNSLKKKLTEEMIKITTKNKSNIIKIMIFFFCFCRFLRVINICA